MAVGPVELEPFVERTVSYIHTPVRRLNRAVYDVPYVTIVHVFENNGVERFSYPSRLITVAPVKA